MFLLSVASLIFLTSCSNFGLPNWDEVVIQGVKKDQTKTPKKAPPVDPRDQFIGRYRFVGANIERGSGQLVHIKFCPKDSLFIEKNEFKGIGLIFREKGQYYYDNIYFIDSDPPLDWIAQENLKTILLGNKIIQERKRIRYEEREKISIVYSTILERVDDLLFYNYKVILYRTHKLFHDELVPEFLGEVHCAYGFDSLSEKQKKAKVRDMGF